MPAAQQPSVRAVPDEPNVALRPGAYGQEVVLAFPYDGNLVAAVRTLPGRRFDWDRREWSAPADGWVAAKLTEILRGRPELIRTSEFDEWLAATERRCMEALEHGETPPAARLILTRSVAGERFVLEPFWDAEIQFAFEQQLPG